MRISVVATGIDAEALAQARPAISLVSNRETAGAPALREASSGGYTQPVLTQNAAAPTVDAVRDGARAQHDGEPVPQEAAAAENVAMRGGAFIAPKPVEPGPPRPVPLTQPAVPVMPPTRDAAIKPKGRVPSLIERVTGVGRARSAPAEAERGARQPIPPAIKPAQPRLAPLGPEDRPGAKEDDLLDIPAFLRRQAN